MRTALARTWAIAAPLICAVPLGCSAPQSAPEHAAAQHRAERDPRGAAPVIEVVAEENHVPPGGDGAPRLQLAFRFADGQRVPIEGYATAYAPFRRGVALIDGQKQLVLVTPDGARRVLAREAGAPPARGPSGELVYVARHGSTVEVHVLSEGGEGRIVATGLGSAGVLAPQRDGRVFFVATRRGGGVAGLWVAQGAPEDARCLTNCELAPGEPWGDRFVPLPRDAESISASASLVEWSASDGTRRSVALAEVPPGDRGPLGAEHGGAP